MNNLLYNSSFLLLSSFFACQAAAESPPNEISVILEQNDDSSAIIVYKSAYKTIIDLTAIYRKIQDESSAKTHIKSMINCMNNDYSRLDAESKTKHDKLVIDYMSSSSEARYEMVEAMQKLFIELQRVMENDYFNNSELKKYFYFKHNKASIIK